MKVRAIFKLDFQFFYLHIHPALGINNEMQLAHQNCNAETGIL